MKDGQIEIKNDKDGNVSASIGKKSFPDNKIVENFNTFLQTIEKEKAHYHQIFLQVLLTDLKFIKIIWKWDMLNQFIG